MRKKRDINDWREAAKKAVESLGNAPTKREVRKALRDNISTVFGRRPNNEEVNKLQELMEVSGVIKEMKKSPVKIGAWTEATDTICYQVIPEKVATIGAPDEAPVPSPETSAPEAKEVTTTKDLVFRMSIDIGNLKRGDIWNNGIVMAGFEGYSIVQFVINRDTQEGSKKFFESMKKLKDKKIGYSFDTRTNPKIIEVVEKLMVL